jgi:hypothetical protein
MGLIGVVHHIDTKGSVGVELESIRDLIPWSLSNFCAAQLP